MACDVTCKSGSTDGIGSLLARCIDKDGLEFRARIRYRAMFLQDDVLVAFSVERLEGGGFLDAEEGEGEQEEGARTIPLSLLRKRASNSGGSDRLVRPPIEVRDTTYNSLEIGLLP